MAGKMVRPGVGIPRERRVARTGRAARGEGGGGAQRPDHLLHRRLSVPGDEPGDSRLPRARARGDHARRGDRRREGGAARQAASLAAGHRSRGPRLAGGPRRLGAAVGVIDSWSEWANLLVRWFHVFAGILWIGSTWYFTWLDRQLHADPSGVWMVHSGGFYLVEKQANPRVEISRIHWFRFEALFTWLSGLLLLAIVYYAGGLMEDYAVSPAAAVACVAGTLIV